MVYKTLWCYIDNITQIVIHENVYLVNCLLLIMELHFCLAEAMATSIASGNGLFILEKVYTVDRAVEEPILFSILASQNASKKIFLGIVTKAFVLQFFF